MIRLNLFCHDWSPTESYGRLMREVGDSIERAGLASINRVGYGTPSRAIVPTFGGILSGHPSAFPLFSTMANVGPRLALTMFESTRIPADWAEQLNACGAVVVPSRWLVKIFREGGVTVPLHVVPLGVSRSFVYRARRKKKIFRILAIGDRGKRKGSDQALFAFVKAFGDDPSVELIVKARKYPFGGFTNPNIHLITDDYTDEQMAQLYQSAELMVFPTCGEGFGLPPREAAATGALVITTDFSGTADDLPQWGIPLGYQMGTAWLNHDRYAGVGEWAQPDVDQLASLMGWARQQPLSIRNALGRHYAENTRRLYNWDECAQAVFELWMGVVREARGGNSRSA